MAKKYKYRHREIYKDVKIDVKADTTKELMAKAEKARKRIDRLLIDEDTKLSEFMSIYLKTYKASRVSPDTLAYLEVIGRKIVDGVGDVRVSRIKPLQVQEFLNTLTVYANGYIDKIYQLTCQVFEHAYRNGLTPTDYSLILTPPRGRPSSTGRSITDQEREALLAILPGFRGEIFCKLILYCGIRPGEAMALLWKDIDFQREELTVNKALKRSGNVGYPKTDAGNRTVPIPSHLIPLLKEHYTGPLQNVCVNSNGRPYTEGARRAMWKAVKRRMNLFMGCTVKNNKLLPPTITARNGSTIYLPFPLDEKFDMYFLRHTYCTDLERAGVPINVARRLMGHASIEITAKIYTHYNDESMDRAREMINAASI
jgi:integrase